MSDGATALAVPAYADAVARFSIETAAQQLHGDPEARPERVRGMLRPPRIGGRDRARLDRRRWPAPSLHVRADEGAVGSRREPAGRAGREAGRRGGGPVAAHARTRRDDPRHVARGRHQPLFTAFGPKAIEHRLRMSDARLVVTNVANRAKLDEIAGCPAVATVREPGEALPEHDIDFRAALDAQSDAFEPVLRKGTDLFMMMSTSGTTGCRKACRCRCVRCSRSARTCATRWTCVPATGSGTSPIRAGRTASITRSRPLLLATRRHSTKAVSRSTARTT